MARNGVKRGRPRSDDNSLRRLYLLKQILKGKDKTIDIIISELKKYQCMGVNLKQIEKDLKVLTKAGWPARLVEIQSKDSHLEQVVQFQEPSFAFQWEGSDAAKRMDQNVRIKTLLAKAVVNDLREMEDVKWAILGSGTTVHAVARELFLREEDIGIEGISTANIFVLQEYIRQYPLDITIEITSGTLNWETGCLLVPGGGTYQEGRNAEVAITSFSGLTNEGFHTKPFIDVMEKQRQLDPKNKACKYILIPLEWSKIGSYHRQVTFPEEINDRRYILYTEKPVEPERNKLEIVEHWRKKLGDNFQVRYVK